MRIISYRDLAPGRFAKSVEKIGAALARGDFAAAGLKKLSPTPYWRAKLNDEARLLMQFAPHRGETVCLFLEVIPNSTESRFRRLVAPLDLLKLLIRLNGEWRGQWGLGRNRVKRVLLNMSTP